MNGVDPHAWLADVLERIAACRWRRESAFRRRGRSVAASERDHGDAVVGVTEARP
jgi:hypothetical protein